MDESPYCRMRYSNKDLIAFLSVQGVAQLLKGGGHCLASFEERGSAVPIQRGPRTEKPAVLPPPSLILQMAYLGCAPECGAKYLS